MGFFSRVIWSHFLQSSIYIIFHFCFESFGSSNKIIARTFSCLQLKNNFGSLFSPYYSDPVISNGRWLCNSNSNSNGVVCTNQCYDGFSFDRKDFFRQEISCKCIIDNDGRNQCRWTQRSRVIKEATELLPDFWQNSKLPECLPNDISQKSKYIIQNFRNFFLREITNWIQITTKAVKILNRLKMEI